jgi:hypothetical protein
VKCWVWPETTSGEVRIYSEGLDARQPTVVLIYPLKLIITSSLIWLTFAFPEYEIVLLKQYAESVAYELFPGISSTSDAMPLSCYRIAIMM